MDAKYGVVLQLHDGITRGRGGLSEDKLSSDYVLVAGYEPEAIMVDAQSIIG